jgi:hypothetical protein
VGTDRPTNQPTNQPTQSLIEVLFAPKNPFQKVWSGYYLENCWGPMDGPMNCQLASETTNVPNLDFKGKPSFLPILLIFGHFFREIE